MGIMPWAAADRWYADGTLWTIVGVVVAVVFGAITVWAQFASARIISRNGGQGVTLDGDDLTPASSLPTARALNLSGRWTAGWQSYKDGEEVHRFQPVEIEHVDQEHLLIRALERGADVVDGGYLWEGELRLWDNAVLMGWYAATEGSVRSKGTLYFALHPHGQSATGRWVGLSHDGVVVTGSASLARPTSTNSPETRE
jgi:hypothetical protein